MKHFDLLAVEIVLYVQPIVWLELTQFSRHTVWAVPTSGRYDESDYIRNQKSRTNGSNLCKSKSSKNWYVGLFMA